MAVAFGLWELGYVLWNFMAITLKFVFVALTTKRSLRLGSGIEYVSGRRPSLFFKIFARVHFQYQVVYRTW